MYDYIREMADYEIHDLIINIFNMGRMSVYLEESDNMEEADFDVDSFLGEYSSHFNLN